MILGTGILHAISHLIKAPQLQANRLATRGLTVHSILVELEFRGRDGRMLDPWSD
jgi:hypothetical protein